MGVVHRFKGNDGGFDWEGVDIQLYNQGQAKGASKRVIIGAKDGAKNFSIRYFEVKPGGKTSFDLHKHDHGVIILRGRAKVLIGSEEVEVGYGDAVYIAPNERHQFENISDEPLGFICVKPANKLEPTTQ